MVWFMVKSSSVIRKETGEGTGEGTTNFSLVGEESRVFKEYAAWFWLEITDPGDDGEEFGAAMVVGMVIRGEVRVTGFDGEGESGDEEGITWMEMEAGPCVHSNKREEDDDGEENKGTISHRCLGFCKDERDSREGRI